MSERRRCTGVFFAGEPLLWLEYSSDPIKAHRSYSQSVIAKFRLAT